MLPRSNLVSQGHPETQSWAVLVPLEADFLDAQQMPAAIFVRSFFDGDTLLSSLSAWWCKPRKFTELFVIITSTIRD